MKKICLNIEVHQPMKLQTFRFFEIMNNHYYYDDYENEFNIMKTSEQSYLPANKILLDLIHYYKGAFKMSFLFSGVVLDQFELYAPEMLVNYKVLLSTGCVYLLSGTYSNSFGPLSNNLLYDNQLKLQKERIKLLFGKEPINFPDRNLQYSGVGNQGIRISSGDRKLNDVISMGFSSGDHYELFNNREKLVKALNTCGNNNCVVDIFIPYNIAGDCQSTNRGLLEFLESFPSVVLSKSDFTFANPSEIGDYLLPSLSDDQMDTKNHKNNESFYESCNEMQIDAFEKLYSYSEKIKMCDDLSINKDWLYLQTCDHFYFMNPILYEENEFYRIFLPYDSPYFAYINYMNILTDYSDRLEIWFNNHDKDQKCIYNKIAKVDKYEQGSTSLWRTKKLAGNIVNFVENQI
jgi:alpha-amylase